MKRSEKIQKRKLRAEKRKLARNARYHSRVKVVKDIGNFDIPLSAVRRSYNNNWTLSGGACWPDSSSPTGYSQVCDYYGTCQFPCNGDC